MAEKYGDDKFYLPARFWGLDSLFWAHMKMFALTVLNLNEYLDYKGYYCYGKHPVSRVEIAGYVVSIDERQKLVSYGVDDGTATISCCKWRGDLDEDEVKFELGQLVVVRGKINTFRGERQLNVDSITRETDPNAEVLFWLEAMKLGRTVYNEKFTLPESVQSLYDNKEEILPEGNPLKSYICDCIKKDNLVTLHVATLCSDANVQRIASRMHQQQSYDDRKITDAPLFDVQKSVQEAMKQLEEEGRLYATDTTSDMYEIISHSLNLGPAVLKAVQKTSQGSTSEAVHIRKITEVVRSFNKFRHVTRLQILESVEKLVQSSELYKQSDHEYCLVDSP